MAHWGPPGDPRCAGWNRSLINGSQETLTAQLIANAEKAETHRRLNDENGMEASGTSVAVGIGVGTRVGVGTLGAAS